MTFQSGLAVPPRTGVLSRLGFALAVCLLAVPVAVSAAPVEAPRPPVPLSPQMQQRLQRLTDELGHEEYAVRERATAELSKIGGPAVPALAIAAKSRDLEVCSRAVSVLQEIYRTSARTGQFETTDAAEFALAAVATSENRSAAQRAHLVLQDNGEIAEQRAIAEIRRLGGVIEFRSTARGQAVILPRNPAVIARQQNASATRLTHVVIGDKWTGGDEGLKQIARLRNLTTLYISRSSKKSPVSNQALAGLQASMPQLNIQIRGRAYLGVGGITHPRGCQIHEVKPGRAADRAGLRPGDIITRFNGKKIEGFDDLITGIADSAPGDEIVVGIERNLQPLEIKVTLDVWK